MKVGPDGIICGLIVMASLIVYWQIHTHDFIGYDDDKYVTQNHYARKGLNSESVFWAPGYWADTRSMAGCRFGNTLLTGAYFY
jgi:hypothetical protein